MDPLISANGTIFTISEYNKTNIYVRRALTLKDGERPIGIIIATPDYGDWIYVDGTVAKEDYTGLRILEYPEIRNYSASSEKSDEVLQDLHFCLSEAHAIMEQIHLEENCGCGRLKKNCSECFYN
jgi:hypothetical protein